MAPKKKLLESLPYDLRPMAVELYLLLMTCVFPFVMDDKLFNVTVTRFRCWVFLSIGLVLVLLGLSIWRPVNSIRLKGFAASTALKIFLMVIVVSTLLSSDWEVSFWGVGCRYIGLLFYLIAVLVYVSLKRFYSPSRLFLIEMTLAGIVVIFVGFLNHAGFDPLGTIEEIASDYKNDYLSTIGQMNFFSQYVLLVFGACSAGYLTAHKKEKVFWLVGIFFCGIGIFIGKSDGALLGLGAGLILMPWLFQEENRKDFLVDYFGMLTVFFIGVMSVGLWTKFGSANFFAMKGLYKKVLNYPAVLVAIPVILEFCTIFFRLLRQPQKSFRKWTGILYRVCLIGLIALVCILLIWANVPGLSKLQDTTLYKLFHFNNTWGTDRGGVWTEGLQLFFDSSILHKLFGNGPASTGTLLTVNADFDNVHNELLQYLLTIGIFGLICYLVFFFVSVRSSIHSKSEVVKGAGLMLIMYGANSLVSLAQPLTTPFIFLAAGIIAAGEMRERKI